MSTNARNIVRAVVDHDLCVGVGMCCQLGAGAFALNADGQSEFRADGDWTEEALREAVDACPMSAIMVIEDKTAGG